MGIPKIAFLLSSVEVKMILRLRQLCNDGTPLVLLNLKEPAIMPILKQEPLEKPQEKQQILTSDT